jgi:hypothetical protein
VAKAEQTQLEGSERMVVIWKWIMLKQMKNKFQIFDQLFNSGGTNLVKQKNTILTIFERFSYFGINEVFLSFFYYVQSILASN